MVMSSYLISRPHLSTNRNNGCCASSLLVAFSFGIISSLIGFSLFYNGNDNKHTRARIEDDNNNNNNNNESPSNENKNTNDGDDNDDNNDGNIASALTKNEGINTGLIGSIPLPRRITIQGDDKFDTDNDLLYSASSDDECDEDENDNTNQNTPPSFQLQSLRDDIYTQTPTTTTNNTTGPKPFCFNHAVVRVFDDMISRSVPLYRECMVTLLHWIVRYYQPQTTIYDLGCSTGTTIDFIGRSFVFGGTKRRRRRRGGGDDEEGRDVGLSFVGVDNSLAMVEEARKKLSWMRSPNNDVTSSPTKNTPTVTIHHSNIETHPLTTPTSIIIMNYTLQFIPPSHRPTLLRRLHDALTPGGLLYLSEKVCSSSDAFQETCTNIYQDFKKERGYTKREIARKKEALMNVLVPFTEEELVGLLVGVGFERCQVVLKWNNFTTIVAVKRKRKEAEEGDETNDANEQQQQQQSCMTSKSTTKKPPPNDVSYTNLESLYKSSSTTYLHQIINGGQNHDDPIIATKIQSLLSYRDEFFYRDLIPIARNMESIASLINKLPSQPCHFSIDNDSILCIGRSATDLFPPNDESASSSSDATNNNSTTTTTTTTTTLDELLQLMKPWKKGPLSLFGTLISTEWRSDWKWHRLRSHIDPLDDHVVADLGCANGYFMCRMMDDYPCVKYVVGIDPNYKAWLEWQLFTKFLPCEIKERMAFELMEGEGMDCYVETFNTVFCLGVLYHTHDPIGLLRKMRVAMKKGGQLILDCQGVRYNNDSSSSSSSAEDDDPVALFPKKRYTNARGFWFLPTLKTLINWLTRTNFVDITVFYQEKLSTEEQRADPTWANIKSLHEGLDPNDETRTVEGYPAPYRFYVKCYKR